MHEDFLNQDCSFVKASSSITDHSIIFIAKQAIKSIYVNHFT